MERMQMITGAPPITASITHGLLPSPPEVFMETESPPDRTASAAGEGDGEGKGEGEGEGEGCSPACELFEPAAAGAAAGAAGAAGDVHCAGSMHGEVHVAGELCRLRL